MKFVKMTFLMIYALSFAGCSRSSGVEVIYLNGDVKINGVDAYIGALKEKEISISTGKSSSVIAQMGSDMIFALSEETTLRISGNKVTLDSGRLIASVDDDLNIDSREISLKTEELLFELISRSNVSVLNVYSGKVYVKGIISGTETGGITLANYSSIESVNGKLSPAATIGTDIINKNIFLRDLMVSDHPGSIYISPECISIINSTYGQDFGQRFSLNTISSAYGALSEIVTKSGKKIIGAVRVSGSDMTIYTAEGNKLIHVTDVKSMKRYNGN